MPPAPKFKCLGYIKHGKLRPYYFFENSRGEIIRRQSTGVVGQIFLLDLCPDVAHWRELFPKPGTVRGNKIDVQAAAASLIDACERAGPYWPDDPALLPQNIPKPNPSPEVLANRQSYARGMRRRTAAARELAELLS